VTQILLYNCHVSQYFPFSKALMAKRRNHEKTFENVYDRFLATIV
jgi:hypothetical protein